MFFKRDINNDQIPSEIDIRLDKPKIYDKFKKFRVYEDYAAVYNNVIEELKHKLNQEYIAAEHINSVID